MYWKKWTMCQIFNDCKQAQQLACYTVSSIMPKSRQQGGLPHPISHPIFMQTDDVIAYLSLASLQSLNSESFLSVWQMKPTSCRIREHVQYYVLHNHNVLLASELWVKGQVQRVEQMTLDLEISTCKLHF